MHADTNKPSCEFFNEIGKDEIKELLQLPYIKIDVNKIS